ncbi:hypothetical protein LZZ85_00585 [Terrimonas sp. NA20]|uniref:Lycopene cyclase domain-containing protein n=1 Tax=Terrimonas ginsenosidimutans TaxID=2908004 RepID=A0ABS9KKA0_9BACT|nr:hypothetical protein [Terrimonas ginsenosidimutans]MCG2612746.1 hypothetical protein [Terrimonas ginsenosidimutans]
MLSKLNITYLYFIPFLLSAIFSLKSFSLKWPKHLRTFSVYLLLTFTIEMLGNFWKWGMFRWFESSKENVWILNIGMIVGRAILCYYFFQLLLSTRVKKAISKFLLFYLTFGIINYLFIQKPTLVNTYSIVIGSVAVILFCMFYFREILVAKEIVTLYTLPEFWIAIGTLIYSLFSLPLITGFDFIARADNVKEFVAAYWEVNDVFLIFTYTLYLIAYLCRPHPKSQYKPLSSPH